MAAWKAGLDAFAARLAGRFATQASRFRYAVVAGFALATIGVVTIGAGTTGFADDFFGALGNLFQMQTTYPQYAQQGSVGYSGSRASNPRRQRPHVARRADESKPKLAVHHDQPVRLGRKSMCVRLCDGFAFPVGTYRGEEDRPAHEATCQSECPGARTALYVLPNGSDQIGDAIDVRSGRNYSEMPGAFRYTTFLQDACTCHPREGNRISSLLRDFTLRRGDAVMTASGVKVYHGGDHFPHRPGDFVALAQSRDIGNGRRDAFHAIERASFGGKPMVQRHPAATAQNATPGSAPPATAPLERQASLAP